MSKSSMQGELIGVASCCLKGLVRYGFNCSRNISSLYQKFNDVRIMNSEIQHDIAKLKAQRAKNETIFRKNAPVLRSLSEIITSEPEKLTYLLGGLMIEGGIYVLFSHKGQGKSTFAMQMGLALAKGESMRIFEEYNLPSNTNPQHVIYLDYELSAAQIKARYNGINVQNFHWAGPCQSAGTSDLMKLLEHCIYETPKGENVVLFIDNLTKIGSGYSQPADARDLYANLNHFKSVQKERYGRIVTIVLVTHTQKDAKVGMPITQNNYSGAQDIIISADGVFAIGPTNFGNDTKLFKVLNNRNTKEPDTVSVIKHVNQPYSHFEVYGEMAEDEALAGKKTAKQTPKGMSVRKRTKSKYPMTRTEVEEMREMLEEIDSNTGKIYTKTDIAKHFGIPDSYVTRYLDGVMKPIDEE